MNEIMKYVNLGLDIGSTTVKAVLTDRQSGRILFRRYQRHHAEQRRTLCQLLGEIRDKFAGLPMRVAVCGSGGRPLADQMGACYVQEVVANGAAVRALYPAARTAVELGGQDAKVIFFRQEKDGALTTSDMRMNGSCAGGTGAFIDEIAALLRVPAEAFESLARMGKQVYSISGRTASRAGAASLPRPTSRPCSTRGPAGRTSPCRPSTPSPSRPSAAWPRAWR